MVRYNTKIFINKANKKHINKYDYSLSNYINSLIPLKIICVKHGIFEQTPVSHLRGRGCPLCSGKNKTTKQFISEAKLIHNNTYDYSKVKYINATTPIIVICPIHGDFKQKPSSHLSGWGCKMCGGNNKLTTEEFINKANKIHNNKYNYTSVKYVNSHTKVNITCLIHGDFKQKPNNHLNGANCPKCGKISQRKNKKLTKLKFIEKSNCVHNNKYNYCETKYSASRNKIKIICPKHGIFIQNAGSHLSGHGCPNCNESKGELKIKKLFNKKKVNYVFQKTFNECRNQNNRKLKFDFYLPEHNILIEYDGKQHYKPIEYFGGSNSFKKLNEYDGIKNDFAKSNKIKLIRISYQDYDNIDKILLNTLLI